MFSTMLIVFREILEAALVVSIVMAATRTVPRRGLWVGLGIVGGTIGASLVAVFAEVISNWASGMGQEVFNAGIMFVAVLMLAWHCIWMNRHGREMAQSLGSLGRSVTAGSTSMTGLAMVVGIALLREGSETVLFFLYGIAAGQQGQGVQMAIGADRAGGWGRRGRRALLWPAADQYPQIVCRDECAGAAAGRRYGQPVRRLF